MKTIKPITVSNATLLSSSITETDYPAWSSTTTYTTGDYVLFVNPAAPVIIANSTAAEVGWTLHGLAVDTALVFTTTGTLPSGLSVGTTYYVAQVVSQNSFTVTNGIGGTPISTSSSGTGTHTAMATVHRVFKSLQSANINFPPSSYPAYWEDKGNTNRWRMFDGSITTQSIDYASMSMSLQGTGRVDSVALLNISAAEATITMTDSAEGVVYSKVIQLTSDSGVVDWYSYYYEPIVRKSDLVVTDMPPYADAVIGVTLVSPQSTVGVGAVVIGKARSWGDTQLGASIGIQDYSVKRRDTNGNYVVNQRSFNKRADFTVFMDNGYIDEFQNVMAEFRALPIVYIGSGVYSSSIIYGFYKNFSTTIQYPTVSVCQITLEGLT